MADYMHYITVIKLIAAYIEKETGGRISYLEDKEHDVIVLRWTKLDSKTKKMQQFNHRISFTELETIKEPFAIGQSIIEKYIPKET